MALSRSIRDLLTLAGTTSVLDDDALDELGRRLLEAMILDPGVPEDFREKAVRLLNEAGHTATRGAPTSDDVTN